MIEVEDGHGASKSSLMQHNHSPIISFIYSWKTNCFFFLMYSWSLKCDHKINIEIHRCWVDGGYRQHGFTIYTVFGVHVTSIRHNGSKSNSARSAFKLFGIPNPSLAFRTLPLAQFGLSTRPRHSGFKTETRRPDFKTEATHKIYTLRPGWDIAKVNSRLPQGQIAILETTSLCGTKPRPDNCLEDYITAWH